MSWTLAFVGLATLAAGLAFARVGWSLRARHSPNHDDERAMRAFSLWWLAMGGSTLCVGAMPLVALAPEPPVLAVALLRAASLVLLSLALWGLLRHVVYLYTGRDASRVVGALYLALTLAVLAHLAWSQPVGVAITGWTVEVAGAREGLAISTALLIGAYLLPPIGAGLAYVRLAPRVEDPTKRRRLRVVGWGIVLWVSTHILARASDAGLWQFVTRVGVGLTVAFAIARVYLGPPTRIEAPADVQARLRSLI